MICLKCSQIFASSFSFHEGDDHKTFIRRPHSYVRDEPFKADTTIDQDCFCCIMLHGCGIKKVKACNDDELESTSPLDWENSEPDAVYYDVNISQYSHGAYLANLIPREAKLGVPRLHQLVLIPTEDIREVANRLETSTASDKTLDRAMEWVQLCNETHPTCQVLRRQSSLILPKRLLDVTHESQDAQKTRVIETDHGPTRYRYATLSHCWGNEQPSKLLVGNKTSFMSGVGINTLPRVYQDAIKISRRANIPYLWIDSLCILQDSDEDWLRESAKMGDIYQNAEFNIAATGFRDGLQGLFVDRTLHSILPIPIRVNIPPVSGANFSIPNKDYAAESYHKTTVWRRDVDKAPLNKRAWVVQERTLSPRVIHFGAEQLYFECFELQANEVYPAGFHSVFQDNEEVKHRMIHSVVTGGLGNENVSFDQALRCWFEIMQLYSSAQLTFSSDKLPALSGLAKRVAAIMHCRYLAGMWERNLLSQLNWYAPNSGKVTTYLNEAYRCPSWSWLSVNRPVLIQTMRSPVADRSVAWKQTELLELQVQLEDDSHIFGAVRSGHLKINGALLFFKRVQENDPTRTPRMAEQGIPLVYVSADRGEDLHLTRFELCQCAEETEDLELEVFGFLPLLRTDWRDGLSPLEGLVLIPTSHKNSVSKRSKHKAGEFERFGHFITHNEELKRDWANVICFELPKTFYEHHDGDGMYTITII